jgi:hypothetical protein
MSDLSPDLSARLARLLPRLASDSDGEVLATVAGIRRTLDRHGLDLHDLARRLSGPVAVAAAEAPPVDFLAMTDALRRYASARLRPHELNFINSVAGLRRAGRPLSAKQADWLRDLYAKHIQG